MLIKKQKCLVFQFAVWRRLYLINALVTIERKNLGNLWMTNWSSSQNFKQRRSFLFRLTWYRVFFYWWVTRRLTQHSTLLFHYHVFRSYFASQPAGAVTSDCDTPVLASTNQPTDFTNTVTHFQW